MEEKMTVSEWIKKMIVYSGGNRYDIAHFLKVYAYAKTIGECEHLDENTHLHLRQRRFYMTSPVRCAVKKMAAPTVNIRKHLHASNKIVARKVQAGR